MFIFFLPFYGTPLEADFSINKRWGLGLI